MTVIDNNTYYHSITFHKPHFQRNENQRCSQPSPHLLAQHLQSNKKQQPAHSCGHCLTVSLLFSHFSGGQYLCNSLRDVRVLCTLLAALIHQGHHPRAHTSGQPPQDSTCNWGSTCCCLVSRTFHSPSLFPSVSGSQAFPWSLGYLSNCWAAPHRPEKPILAQIQDQRA